MNRLRGLVDAATATQHEHVCLTTGRRVPQKMYITCHVLEVFHGDFPAVLLLVENLVGQSREDSPQRMGFAMFEPSLVKSKCWMPTYACKELYITEDQLQSV